MKLYYHKTSGGAEYLCSKNVDGTEEGSFASDYIVRIDGDIKKDAELNVKFKTPYELIAKTIKIEMETALSDGKADQIGGMRDVAYALSIELSASSDEFSTSKFLSDCGL